MAIFEDLYLCYQRYRKHFESNFYDDDFVFEKYIGTDHSVIKNVHVQELQANNLRPPVSRLLPNSP